MDKKYLSIIFAIIIILTPVSVLAQEPDSLPPYAPGRLIVKRSQQVSALQISPLQVELQATVVQQFSLTGAELWQIDGMSVEEAMARYQDDPRFEYVQPDYLISLDDPEITSDTPSVWPQAGITPDDTFYSSLYGLNNTGQTGGTADADIDAPEAWTIQTDGDGPLLALIDSGLDYNHPDLAANIWTNPGEIADNGLDDDGNGFVDDIHGWNFYHDKSDPIDGWCSHGTHVAGIIAATGNNGNGVSGVSWKARIMIVRIMNDSGYGWISDAIDGINYAVMMGADISNNSWAIWSTTGYGFLDRYPAFTDALSTARQSDHLLVVAAGNSGEDTDIEPTFPTGSPLDNIISVAATDHNDNLASYSNYGLNTVDLAAPGDKVQSTLINNAYGSKSGTSMATPHVTGAALLLWTKYPELSYQSVRNMLLAGVDHIPAMVGKSTTEGRLNIHNTLSITAEIVMPDVLTATVKEGQSVDLPLELKNNGDNTMYWNEVTGEVVSLSPQFGSVSAGHNQNVMVTIDSTGLAVGAHIIPVNIAANDPADSVATTLVLLNVLPLVSDIETTPDAIEMVLEAGKQLTHTLTISSAGDIPLQGVLATEADWLTVSPAEIDIIPDNKTDITLTFNAAGLERTDLETILTITSNDPDEGLIVIPVKMSVFPCVSLTMMPDITDDQPWFYSATSEILTVQPVISNVEDMAEFSFQMGFDPSLLQIDDVAVLTDSIASAEISIDNDAGHLTISAGTSGGATTGTDMARITLQPQRAGSGSLTWQNVEVINGAGQSLPVCSVAEEVAIVNTYHPVDFDQSCVVDQVDVFSEAAHWLSQPVNTRYDLDGDTDNDIVDVMKAVSATGWNCMDSLNGTAVAPAVTPPATVHLGQSPVRFTAGQTITVEVLVEDALNLGGFELSLIYPSDLEFIEVQSGEFLTDSHSLGPVLDETAGVVTWGEYRIDSTGISGNGTLSRITFLSHTDGTATLELESPQLATPTGAVQPAHTTNYTLFVPLIIR